MKTNLFHFGWIIALMALVPAKGFAQTEADKVNERLEKIEQQLSEQQTAISQQQATISSLRSEIEAVTKQNLALKKNLKLIPTIAKAKLGESVEYRVVEVTGDPATRDVHVIMTIENIGDMEKKAFLNGMEIIDELGNGYNDKDRSIMKINGVYDNLYNKMLNLHAGAPYTIDTTIQKYNPEAQYIKVFSIEGLDGAKHLTAKFENLPIKWVADE